MTIGRADHPPIAIIFARLTPSEHMALRGMPYSGSTGPDAQPAEVHGAYVATYISELPRGLALLGWRKVRIKRRDRQWVVTRKRRTTDR